MRYVISIIILLSVAAGAMAQGKKGRTSATVKKEQTEMNKKIASTEKSIAVNKQEIQSKLNKLNSIKSSIDITTKKIESITANINKISKQIDSLSDSIDFIEKRINTLKEESAKGLVDSRKRRKSMSELALVFSSETFQQALKRQNYFKQLNRLAAARAVELQELQQRLIESRKKLNKLKAQQTDLKNSLLKEKDNLALQTSELNIIIEDLQKQKSSLQAILADQQAKAKRLDQELNRLIAEEMRRAQEEKRAEERRIAEQKRIEEQKRLEQEKALADSNQKQKGKKKKGDKPTEVSNKSKNPAPAAAPKPAPKQDKSKGQDIPSSAKLTQAFAANKGKLTFPVDGRHKIVSSFGVHEHENLQFVKTENTGIDIEAPQGSNAIAAYDGVVSSIFIIDGYNNVVMVRHGDYLTVYANLDQIYVKRGDSVSRGQKLGRIYSDKSDGGRSILHFEVRKETQKLNPTEWVGR